MSPRDLRFNALLTPALIAVVALLLLAVAHGRYARLDLTRNGDFSLEPATEDILERLPGPLTIRVYFSPELEPPYHRIEGVVRDTLEEYRTRNPGRIRVEWIDPAGAVDRRDEARRLGVRPATLQVTDQGRREAREIWMGMVFLHEDRSVALPTIRTLGDLEFQITRRIREVVEQRPRPVVGFLTGHGEPDVAGGEGALAGIHAKIAETYEPRRVDLSGENPMVTDDVDLLVVLGPRQALGEDERLALDQFLMSGRPLALFRSNLTPDAARRELRRSSDNLGDLLAYWGLAMDTAILVDRQANGLMPVPVKREGRTETAYVNHPLIPLVSDLDREQLVTRGVDTLALPLASPIRVVDAPPGCDGCRVHELAFTGPSSAALTEVGGLDAEHYATPTAGEQPGPFLVVAALEGAMLSYYGSDSADGHAVDDRSPEGTRLLLVGSADYALKNLGFFLNALDWLALDAELLALRPDLSLPPAMQPMEPGQAHVVRLANVLGVPIAVTALCFVRARRRRIGR